MTMAHENSFFLQDEKRIVIIVPQKEKIAVDTTDASR
jgi:hypothetical protein